MLSYLFKDLKLSSLRNHLLNQIILLQINFFAFLIISIFRFYSLSSFQSFLYVFMILLVTLFIFAIFGRRQSADTICYNVPFPHFSDAREHIMSLVRCLGDQLLVIPVDLGTMLWAPNALLLDSF